MCNRNYMIDLLNGMFYYFPNERKLVHLENREIHEFFYEQKSNHPDILSELTFYNTVSGKHSPMLDRAFMDLRSMGLLGSWGLNPQEYVGHKYRCCKPAVERIGNESDLESLSKEFQERFATDSS